MGQALRLVAAGLAACFGFAATDASAARLIQKDEGMFCIALIESLNKAESQEKYFHNRWEDNYCGGTTSNVEKYARCRYYDGAADAADDVGDDIRGYYNNLCGGQIRMNQNDLVDICTGTKFGSRTFKNNSFCKGFKGAFSLAPGGEEATEVFFGALIETADKMERAATQLLDLDGALDEE